MTRVKHILRLLAKVLSVFAVVALLGFVDHSGSNVPVRSIAVSMEKGNGLSFIDPGALHLQVVNGVGTVIGTAVGKVDETAIEMRLRSIPCVASADVYHTLDGVLHVRVERREPIVRVINADGSGFYIDREGWTMPLSDGYTARVLVVTGQLAEPFATVAPVNVMAAPDSVSHQVRCRAILAMARTLDADPLWNAMFEQVVMDADGNMELIARVGPPRVRIGDGSNLGIRLNKLRTFYTQGIPQTDWRRYRMIDLRFNDQVVCTK